MPGSSITSSYTNPVSPFIFSNIPSTSFNVAAKSINLGTTHNFITGQSVYLAFSNSNHDTGLAVGGTLVRYFAIVVDSTTIQLAATSSNAASGISVSFTAMRSGVTANFYKVVITGRTSFKNLTLFPCYSQSDVVFNSNIPVEINISYPPYQSIYSAYPEILSNDYVMQLCGLTNKDLTASWYCGVAANAFTMVQLYSNTTGSDSGVYLTNAGTLGWKQKYVITPDKKIQMWAGLTTPALIHTSTAIAANTELILRYGANLNNFSISDCTIKYL